MKHIILALLVFSSIAGVGQSVSYISASPYPVEITQPDGTNLTILGAGDEFNHFTVTEDGYTVLKNKNGIYEFARKNKSGKLDLSGFQAKDVSARSNSDLNFLNSVSKYLKGNEFVIQEKRAVTEEVQRAFPSSGTRKVLLLLIHYPDDNEDYSVSNFNNMMNQSNYNGTGSFRDYFYKASDGDLSLSVDVFGWYVSQNNASYYADDNGYDVARELVAEAVDAAEAAGVDFSEYDNDNNGTVDNLMVVHSGPGAEEGSRTEYIWSHSTGLYSYGRNYDGVSINNYVIMPETRSYGMVGIGVFCHEFGHALGLPDLYDTNTDNGDSEGLGNWCLMASGGWLNREKSPAMLSAWTREKLRWINPTVISAAGDYSLRPASTSAECYKIRTPNSNEYFLLENRYKTSLDVSLPGSGLAIFHINTSRSNNSDENNKVSDLEEADGLNDLDRNADRGDSGDLFPGSTNNTEFNDNTYPDAQTYTSELTGINIHNIELDGTTIRFTLGEEAEPGIDLTYNSKSLNINNTEIDVDVQVKNQGLLNSTSFKVAYYLSENNSVTTSDYLVGTKNISSLNADASENLNFVKDVLSVTPEIPDGTYYVGFIIDSENDIDELNEDNNSYVFTSGLVEIETLPNLTFNTTENAITINDNDVSVDFQVKNNGVSTAESNLVKFYVSLNSSISSSDYFIGEVSVEDLDPGESANKSFAVNVLSKIPNLPENEYYVGYVIDAQDVVDEANESDNDYIFTNKKVEYILFSNLTFNPEINSLKILASKIMVGLQVINDGEKKSENFRVGYYLSKDAAISTSDYLMAYENWSGIEKNDVQNKEVTIDITNFEGDIKEGNYYVGYIIDYLNDNDELDETDNKFVFTADLFHYCPPDVSEIEETICEGESIVFDGENYSDDGIYEFVYESKTGCDSVIVLNITVNPTHHIELNETICFGESFTVGETAYSRTGIYTQTFSNQFGCDSVVTLYLNVYEPIEIELSESVCEGESVEVAGNEYFETGIYSHSLTSVSGCDSTVILNLTVHPNSNTSLVETICAGENVLVGNSVYSETGIYTDILSNRFGCDSVVILDLTVNPSYKVVYEEVICEGDSVWIDNTPFFETGIFVNSFTTQLGCDSTIILNLTVNPVHDTLLQLTLCEGESVQVGNSVYNQTGVYVENLTNQFGCDSIVTLDLIVNPVHETLLGKIICEGDSVVVGNSVYKFEGNYTDVLSNRFGCDSTVYLSLSVNPVNETDIFEDICEGTEFTLGGIKYSQSGIFEHVFSNRFGCDSTVILYLNVVPLPVVDLGDDQVLFSSEEILLDAGSGLNNYLWNTGETTPDIVVSNSKGTGPGTYSVTVTDEYLCSGYDEIKITIYDDKNQKSGKEPLFKVFPNPSKGDTRLMIEDVSGNYTVQVLTENGTLVYQQEFNAPGNKFIQQIDLNHIQSGFYNVRIISDDKTAVRRLIIFKN